MTPDFIHCERCKRPIPDCDATRESNIAYCYACNFYFPVPKEIARTRRDTWLPNGAESLRLRVLKDELTISIRWLKNYRLGGLLVPDFLDTPLPFKLAALLLNTTTITADKNTIRIEHKPLDLLPFVFYQVSHIEQLFVRQVDRLATEQIFLRHAYFNVLNAKLKTGEEVTWLWNLKLETLLFIEQELERVTGIEDRKMPEEIV